MWLVRAFLGATCDSGEGGGTAHFRVQSIV